MNNLIRKSQSSETMDLKINISPIKFSKTLLIIVSVLLFTHILYLITRFFYGYSYRDYFHFFYLDSEGNLPTLYATISLAIAGMLLLIVGYLKKKLGHGKYGYWLFIGAIFILISYDEASGMHENINEIFWDKLPDLPVYLGFGWVIPYFFLTVIIGLFSISFLKSIPKKTAFLFIIAGAVFVTGAMGMEFFGAYLWATAGGQDSLLYNFFATIEELLEMLGIVLFIYAILDYITIDFGDVVKVNFEKTNEVIEKQNFKKEIT